MRIASDLWHRLDQAARDSGRSLSQEAELRLAQTFEREELLDQVLKLAYGPHLAGLLMAIGYTMKVAGSETARSVTQSYEAMDRWPEFRKAFDEAMNAANLIFSHYREKTVDAPFDEPVAIPKSRRKGLGENLAGEMIRAVDNPAYAPASIQPLARKVNALLGRLAEGNQP